jgi:hypothetical protein
MHKFYEFKNLNEAWVIVSRHNGNVFFQRNGYVTRLKNYPNADCIYYSKEQAEAALLKLNETRRKCKYTIENASRYFVNSYKFVSWGGAVIRNIAIPIKEVQDNKTKISSFEEAKIQLENYLIREKSSDETSLKEYEKAIPGKREQFEREIQQELAYKINELAKTTNMLSTFKTEEFDSSLYETQGDKIVKILFSQKPKEQIILTHRG